MKKFVLVACVLLTPVLANADPINLSYLGNPFITASGPLLTTSDRLTAQAVIDFTGAGSYTATSWGITVSTSIGPVSIFSNTPGLTASAAQFTVDQFGNVLTWNLFGTANVIGGAGSPAETLFTINTGNVSGQEDFAVLNDTVYPCFLTDSSCGRILIGPGQWTTASVPETSSLALLATGLVIGGFAARKRPRLFE